jgi:hypothetical protein
MRLRLRLSQLQLVAREARRQTRKVLNPAWNRMRSFRVCTVDDDRTTKVGDGRSSAPEQRVSPWGRSATLRDARRAQRLGPGAKEQVVSIGLILLILLVIFLLGGFSGRFGGYGYGYGHGGIGVIGVIVIVVVVLLLTGRL